MMNTTVRVLAVLLMSLVLVGLPRTSRAQPPARNLLDRLALHAAHFEAMRTHASCAIDGRIEHVDSDGKPNSTKQMKARLEADGTAKAKLNILTYTENGEDKTEEARQKARNPKDKTKPDIRMPFLASEQDRYVFNQVAVDTADASRVQLAFVPKARAEDTIEGSAWVDTVTGTVISAGFKLSKTPMFVDYVNITVEFGANTSLGPAISKVTMEGKGGVLFLRKRFRGAATVSDYRIAP